MNIKRKSYEFWFLLLRVFKIIYFSVNNLICFFIFFELRIIPILIIILNWGSNPERLKAGMYMIIYTLAGSLPLLVRLIFFLSINTRELVWMYSSCYQVMKGNTRLTHLSFLIKKEELIILVFSRIKFLMFLLTIRFLIKLPVYGLHL